MRRAAVTGLALAVALTLGAPLYAQRTTGAIAGNVVDDTGAALPGVNVAVSGDRIVGSLSAVTNAEGFYRFIGLPPGNYDVTFALANFASQRRAGIRVSVGGTVQADVTLGLGDLAEELTVTAEAPVVDVTSNKVGSNYEREWVENAPMPRNSFFDLVAAAPGSLRAGDQSSRTMAYGASYDENSFQLDGTDVNDNFFNEALAEPNIDAIEEIEVLSLGAPAEYGNMTGAVYNIVTRQGTNEFHGDVSFYYQNEGLTSRNTSDEQDGGFPYLRDHFYDVTAQLGGPLIEDRLWFFASYQAQRDKFSPDNVDPNQFVDRTDSFDRYFAKLNWQLNPSHKLIFSYHQDESSDPYSPGPTDAPSTFVARTAKTPTPGVGYTGVLSDRTVLDVRYGGFYGDVFLGPADESLPRDAARVYNLDTSAISGGHYYWYDLGPKRTTLNAKVSHLADDFLGASHDFRFGVQYNTSEAGGVYGYNDLLLTYQYDGVQSGYGYTRSPFSYSGNTDSLGVFFDDTVRVNDRLSLNAGVRYDRNKAFSRAQDELDENGIPTGVSFPETTYYTWNTVSPRLGFNLKLTADGRTVLKGHWGKYHRAVATGEFANVVGPSIKPVFFGFLDPGTLDLIGLEQITDNSNLSIDPDLRAPRVDQFIVSLEREIVRNLGVQVNYIHKKGTDFVAWQDLDGIYETVNYIDDQGEQASGVAIPVMQLQNSRSDLSYEIRNREEMNHNIDSVSLVLLKRMVDNWSLNASVTWLRSEGRTTDSNGGSSAEQRGGLQFRTFGRDPNDFVNSGGRLRGDVPWQVKTQLIYQFPAGFTASANYSFRSGANLVRRVRAAETNLSSQILAQERGTSGRLPSAHFLDLRVQKEFSLGGEASFVAFANVFNLLNDDANETVVSSLGTSSAFNDPAVFVLPRRVMLGAKLRF